MANLGHGGNTKEISRKNGIDYNKIMDFSSNINPLGMSDKAKASIIENLNEVEKYPDITYFELKSAIAKFENINSDNFILGNGAAEVLFNVVRALNPKKVLIPVPTFSEYYEATEAINAEINFYNISEKDNFSIRKDILDYINEDLDLIFICNPNNPTGVVTDKDLLSDILKKAKKTKTTVLIDESFLDFIKEDLSMISYIEEYQNLIIIKSLTKFFALPGMRIGYGISSNKELKDKIEKITPAWNINILADIATRASLEDKNYIKKTIDFMEHEKTFLYNALKEIKELTVYNPSVNFILFKINVKINLKEKLLKENILIRSCSNYEGLDDSYYRIAVRTNDENIILIKSLKNILNMC
ncbi:threonine-phosphate decarboxylase CobD [Clostridium uliginosum]|uniref:threonine-phosphate decarboxylase n=1 Tax=Clostridium uliginosum TaxID=119641 RepID=A0A1I1NYC4_9CLOT|nr:threonine-phosphate decarboxylase CobD [Clostridium uliginosum]SFD02547.1 L-threonine-O-3-phosphate decarboxylase/histidinol-phosphate aminotransferase,TIGR01141 [Clostridium uliginosum]